MKALLDERKIDRTLIINDIHYGALNIAMKNQYLSTSQAAKLCNVTRHTIINWVNNGRVKSIKTAGGHRRIPREDFFKFITDNKIVNACEGYNKNLKPRCWEFRSFRKSSGHNCADCLVFQEKADKCFLLVEKFGSVKIQCQYDCLNCAYLMEYYPKEREIIKAEALNDIEKSVQSRSVQAPPCWRFKDFVDSDKHDCTHCLVFKRKADRCYLAVKEFGSERRRCKHDCLSCEYLLAHYPEEKMIFQRINSFAESGRLNQQIERVKK